MGGILLLAFALRLAAVLWLSDTVPYSDAQYYDLAAQKISTSWSFPFDRAQVEEYGKLGWWPPVYPFFLAALYRVFGARPRVAVLAQVLLGTFVCWLVYRIGRRAAGDRVGEVAAALVAVDPTYVFLTNILASENLYVVWLALGMWLVGHRRRDARAQALSGVALALGALTRAVGLGVPFIAVLWLRGRAANRRAWLTSAAWMLGACALTIAPWTLRNTLVVGTPALVCFGGGLNFYFGHNPVSVGYRDLRQTPMAQLATQAEIDRVGYKLGMEYIAQEPFGVATRAARKVADLFGSANYAPHSSSAIMLPQGWQTDPEAGRIAAALRARQRAKNTLLDGIFTVAANVHGYAILAGALAACIFFWRRLPDELRLSAYLALYWVGSHALFWAQPRFRYPMDLFLALLSAFALSEALRSRARRPQAP